MLKIIKRYSPNFFTPAEMEVNYHVPFNVQSIRAVVLHGTSGPLQSSLAWLCNPQPGNPAGRVSANYVISRAGVIYELVPWESGLRAFANGIVEHHDTSIKWLNDAVAYKINPNWLTVSIEHEASAQDMLSRASMTDAQFNSSIDLTAYILSANGLKASHQTIIGHNQISGVNKFNCPGVIFPPAYTEVLIKRHSELG